MNSDDALKSSCFSISTSEVYSRICAKLKELLIFELLRARQTKISSRAHLKTFLVRKQVPELSGGIEAPLCDVQWSQP